MQIQDSSSLSFLYSNKRPPEDGFFQGYFFSGNDYIYGQTGAGHFSEATGHAIKGFMDGCYVLVRRHQDVYEFVTDFSGYKALYYYHDGSTWAVSNSFSRLVDYLRLEIGHVEPNYAHLGSVCSTNSTNNQLFSFETLARGVRVSPRGMSLVMTPNKPILLAKEQERSNNYLDGLTTHLERWVSRFETLMHNADFQFSIDLTGGLDSRTNLALAVVARNRLSSDAVLPRFTCAGSLDTSLDYKVASDLCNHYGLKLNGPNRVPRVTFSSEQSYAAFYDLSLGVYYPVVLPAVAPSAYRVHAGGGGGEVHRDFYNPDYVERFFRNHGKRNIHEWLGMEAARSGRDAVDFLAKNDNGHPLRLHYREFRHRFHGGRLPRLSASFTPLDSSSAGAAQQSAGFTRIEGGQFNYDVLASLAPELLDLPFDDPAKALDEEIRARLTSVELAAEPCPGRLWVGDEKQSESRTTSTSTRERAKVLRQAVFEAAEDPFVASLYGGELVARAKELSHAMSMGESIGNSVNGYPISALLSARLVSPAR